MGIDREIDTKIQRYITWTATNGVGLFDDLAMNDWEAGVYEQEVLIKMIIRCVWLSWRRGSPEKLRPKHEYQQTNPTEFSSHPLGSTQTPTTVLLKWEWQFVESDWRYFLSSTSIRETQKVRMEVGELDSYPLYCFFLQCFYCSLVMEHDYSVRYASTSVAEAFHVKR